MVVPYAKAECGVLGKSIKPASFILHGNSGHVMRAALDDDRDDVSIVGMDTQFRRVAQVSDNLNVSTGASPCGRQ
jgi:hypothetical protein